MDTLLPRHKYVVLAPQVGPLSQQDTDRWSTLVARLEESGAQIVSVEAVAGITRVQFVDITHPHDSIDRDEPLPTALDIVEEYDRARQTRSFGT